MYKETLGRLISKVPFKMKISLGASLIIGLLGHLYCYTSTLFLHDTAAIFWEPQSFAAAATGTRWLFPVYDWILSGVQLPWVDGVLTLVLYGISAWLVCEILKIEGNISIVLIAGLMVLSPTAISSNAYLSSAPIYASALLFSCLAVYAFYRWKYGLLWFILFSVICEGSYAAYIGFTLCLFFLRMYITLLDSEKEESFQLIKEHFQILFGVLISLIVSYGIIKLLTSGTEATLQERVSVVEGFGIMSYLENIKAALGGVRHHFFPGGSTSYMQGCPVYYKIFLAGMIVTCVMYLYMFFKKKAHKKILCVLLFLVDAFSLLIAMNLFRVITPAHLLMQFGFLSPWLFSIQLYEYSVEKKQFCVKKRTWIRTAYSWVVVLMICATLGNWWILANTSYTKASMIYEANVSLMNRVVERIESVEGYEPGVTPVIFAGSVKENYAPYHKELKICDSMTGIGSTWWDTGLTYNFPIMMVIQQHLGINMNIINYPQEHGLDLSELLKSADALGIDLDTEQFFKDVEAMESFPSKECVRSVGGILVFKFSE